MKTESITVFHHEVYRNSYVDYNDPKIASDVVAQDLDNVLGD